MRKPASHATGCFLGSRELASRALLGVAVMERAGTESRCCMVWHFAVAHLLPSSLPEQALTNPFCVSVRPPCQRTCFVVTLLQELRRCEFCPVISC